MFRFGIRYMAPEGSSGGGGGAAINVISPRHEEFKGLLEKMESEGRISNAPNEDANLDTPIGTDTPSRRQSTQLAPEPQQQSQQPQQSRQQEPSRQDREPVAREGNLPTNDTLDDSGVDASQNDSDTSGEATSNFAPSKHSDDLVRLAASYGLSRGVVERLDEEALRMTLGDLARRQSFDPRLREGQQLVPQPYPQQAQQSQSPQFDQQSVPQVDLRAKLEQMRKSGDYDAKDLELFEGIARKSEDAERLALRANQLLQQQLAVQQQQQIAARHRDARNLDVMIDQLAQSDVYGLESDFQIPPEQWTDAMRKQNANALSLQQRVDWYRMTRGAPLTPDLVKQAHFELFGAAKAAEKKQAAQRVVQQSRTRMGSSNQPGRGSGSPWSGAPGRDPELVELFNSRQVANRGY